MSKILRNLAVEYKSIKLMTTDIKNCAEQVEISLLKLPADRISEKHIADSIDELILSAENLKTKLKLKPNGIHPSPKN